MDSRDIRTDSERVLDAYCPKVVVRVTSPCAHAHEALMSTTTYENTMRMLMKASWAQWWTWICTTWQIKFNYFCLFIQNHTSLTTFFFNRVGGVIWTFLCPVLAFIMVFRFADIILALIALFLLPITLLLYRLFFILF